VTGGFEIYTQFKSLDWLSCCSKVFRSSQHIFW
jgi:hypothetical protein